MGWKSCILLYEEGEGLIRMQEVLKSDPLQEPIKITIRQLKPGLGQDYRLAAKNNLYWQGRAEVFRQNF